MKFARPSSKESYLSTSLAIAILLTTTPYLLAEEQRGQGGLVLRAGDLKQWATLEFAISPHPRSIRKGSQSNLGLAITTPAGEQLTVPAYRDPDPTAGGGYSARFTPREAGVYSALLLIDGSTQRDSDPVRFDVAVSTEDRGFLQLIDGLPYAMRFDNGELFRGVGTNIAWEPRRRYNHKFTYDRLFPRIAQHGLNTVRVWSCPWNMPMEWDSPRLGEYNEQSLRQLDETLELARENGLYVVLVLGYHGELQTVSGSFPNNDRWKENPYNAVNGGPCDTPGEFFTNEQAKALYKQRLRMLAARVAGHPHLLAWEFWNEIDHIQRRGPARGDAIVAWHEEMADYLHRIDAYDRPVTTSISTKAPPGLWELDGVDLIMLHLYGRTDSLPSTLAKFEKRYHKPVVAGEYSYSWRSAERDEADDFERELRLGQWRGLLSPTPILPMTWWWEYHDSRDHWRFFQPISEVTERMTRRGNLDWKALALDVGNQSVECLGLEIGNEAFVWVRNPDDNSVANLEVTLLGPRTGDYRIERISTRTGDRLDHKGITLQSDHGTLTIKLELLAGGYDTLLLLSEQ